MTRPGCHMFCIGLYREQHEKIFLSETTRHRASIDIWYVVYLVDLYLFCSTYSPGAKKWPGPGGHMFYIGLYREQHEKIFLSEITRHRALIVGMKHHLVDLYQVCLN